MDCKAWSHGGHKRTVSLPPGCRAVTSSQGQAQLVLEPQPRAGDEAAQQVWSVRAAGESRCEERRQLGVALLSERPKCTIGGRISGGEEIDGRNCGR